MYSYADRIRAVLHQAWLACQSHDLPVGIPNQERIERLVSPLPEASGFASEPSAKGTKVFAAAKTGCGCSLPRPRSLYCRHDEGFGLPGSRNVDCVGSARLP